MSLFTLEDLDFGELVPRWLALKDKTWLGYNILFGLRYIGAGYSSGRDSSAWRRLPRTSHRRTVQDVDAAPQAWCTRRLSEAPRGHP